MEIWKLKFEINIENLKKEVKWKLDFLRKSLNLDLFPNKKTVYFHIFLITSFFTLGPVYCFISDFSSFNCCWT